MDDVRFARRAYLDIWGLLPSPEALSAFLKETGEDKRELLVRALLSDNQKYAEHWISFWNDLLRNEDGVTYYSETAARKSITGWLLASLVANLPYDRFVTKLVNPQSPGDPDGFLVGVNWRGETSAAVTPWMQASQNTAQVFLGVNLKCNACHDSFVSHWKLKDAYALAGYFSPDPKLQLYRCDRALDQFVDPGVSVPGSSSRNPPSSSLDDRRATLAAIFTDPRNGRLPRTLVNRVWQRLFGYGLVANPDDMDVKPWNAALLDWLAADFVSHGYDVKQLLSRSCPRARTSCPPSRDTRSLGRATTCSRVPRSVASPRSSSPTRSDRSPASGASIRRRTLQAVCTAGRGERRPTTCRWRSAGRFAIRSRRHASRQPRPFKGSSSRTARC